MTSAGRSISSTGSLLLAPPLVFTRDLKLCGMLCVFGWIDKSALVCGRLYSLSTRQARAKKVARVYAPKRAETDRNGLTARRELRRTKWVETVQKCADLPHFGTFMGRHRFDNRFDTFLHGSAHFSHIPRHRVSK